MASNRCAIMATGPSMSYELAKRIQMSFDRRIVVSNAFTLDPLAECLVSTDVAWWKHYQPDFDGKKYCGKQTRTVNGVIPFGDRSDLNSGILAIRVARILMGCTRLYLFGVDMNDANGAHFFGSHDAPLRDTPKHRWPVFHKQFSQEAVECEAYGVSVFNCNPDSALTCFTKIPPGKVLECL